MVSDVAMESEESDEYYDLRKVLPRFYRLCEHINKGRELQFLVL